MGKSDESNVREKAQVGLRLDQSTAASLDVRARALSKEKGLKVTRSDVIRIAILAYLGTLKKEKASAKEIKLNLKVKAKPAGKAKGATKAKGKAKQ